jgi:hypothetical protein
MNELGLTIAQVSTLATPQETDEYDAQTEEA